MKSYVYSGAGNSFVVIDGREEQPRFSREPSGISSLCREFGTDGLMVLSDSVRYDFRMEYYNPDGSCGMMCGNGGRCITAFAADLGIRPEGGQYVFEAPDAIHTASIIAREGRSFVVRLGLRLPTEAQPVLGGWFIDTGARHFVKFVDDVDSVDIDLEGGALRRNVKFGPEGANVNFVRRMQDGSLRIRTFEKGVERETLACGTGAVAAAFVSNMHKRHFSTTVHARIADLLVESSADGVFLTGPVERIIINAL